jgi:hypothetical protein
MLPQLALVLLLAGCFSLSTVLGPQFNPPGARQDFMASLLGESRTLFARQAFVRSDVYFHSGYYPSVFERTAAASKSKAAVAVEPAGHVHDENCRHDHHEPGHVHGEQCRHGHEEHVHSDKCSHGDDAESHQHSDVCDHGDGHGFLGAARDRMDSLTRHFFVSKHTHLTEKGTNMPKEILPWLKLSARINPRQVESYTVGAYWLRGLGKHAEAEEFLRDGLRHNPSSYDILLELGRCYFDKRDYERARNLWEAAVQRWREQEHGKAPGQQNLLAAAQLLNHLVRVEIRTGRKEQALEWLKRLKNISPHPDEIEKRIVEVREGRYGEFERELR